MIKEIMNVFAKEYKEETEYLCMKGAMHKKIKLQSNELLSDEELISRFNDIDSKCQIDVGKDKDDI